MTWLAPWALGAGALGMLGVIAAHLLARQRPRALALATARFLPAGTLEATTVQPLPTDRWWLLLRLLIIALFALGAAQPVRTGARVATRTVLLLDRTLPLAEQRRVVAALAPTDAVIPFDSAAIVTAPDSAVRSETTVASLSSALGRLVRARDSLARGADALRVTVASPFEPASLDPASATLRALLPDSITAVSVQVPEDSAAGNGPITVRATGDDPVAATAALLGDSVAPRGTRLVRAAELSADDSSATARGATVIWWPVSTHAGIPGLQAITVAGSTWIAAMARDSLTSVERTLPVVGWWADGAPAVTRRVLGSGCVVRVHAALPTAGDQTLSLAAQAWLAALSHACTPERDGVHAAPSWLARGTASIAPTLTSVTHGSTLAPWLVGAALLLAAVEIAARLRGAAR